jgi:hypothetical protein
MRTFLRKLLTETGPLIALAVAAVMTFGIIAPASAQFFDFGFGRRPPPPQQRGGGGFFAPFGGGFAPEQPAPPPRVDYSRAPAPAKREVPAERNVLVLGDAMADWLAYGLEDALSETPELGVIRKHKTVSGLIRYQPKGEPSDWIAAAKQILANEKPDVIVVMLGLHDRMAIREAEKKPEPKAEKDKKGAKKDSKKDAKPDAAKSDIAKDDAAKKDGEAAKPDDEKTAADHAADKPSDADVAPDDEEDDKPAAPKTTRAANGIAEFRDERWVELYSKKIEEMIGVLKSKGVPVLWVGLPAVRGPKATSDMLFLDALYRDVAGKTGITYVDVWDGFVDDAGRFLTQGPDFEGQIRRLRTADGVFFTKAGARKLAHYTEREIRRVLATRLSPMALPSEPLDNTAPVRPGVAGPRPLVGPVVPLVASSVGTDELLGGVGTRPAAVDALAARTLVKGEALAPPAGRADDFSWPRREIGKLEAPAGEGIAAATPGDAPAAAPKPKRPVPAATSSSGFFGFETRPAPQRSHPRETAPRPPGSVRSSSPLPRFFTW